MKKSIFMSILCICLCGVAHAQITFVDSGIQYRVLSANTVEVIAQTPQYSGSPVIPETVSYQSVEYTVTQIGENAFLNSTITAIELPKTITHIVEGAFFGCSDLHSFSVHIQNMSYRSLDGVLYSYDVSELIQCPALKTSIQIQEYTTRFVAGAFAYCTNLTTITIPEAVHQIEARTFYNANNLSSITLPQTLTSIGENAFYNCHALQSIRIPASVTVIEDFAFSMSSGLQQIIIESTTPPQLGIGAFEGLQSGASMYVPQSAILAYQQSTGWGSFSVLDIAGLSASTIFKQQIVWVNHSTLYVRAETCFTLSVFTLHGQKQVTYNLCGESAIELLDLPGGAYAYVYEDAKATYTGLFLR
jgi:hypothetical protein